LTADREEPTTGPTINAFLKNAKSVDENKEAIHLLFVANRWLLSAKMREELISGQHLIVDR
jgi:thymidylate kinase